MNWVGGGFGGGSICRGCSCSHTLKLGDASTRIRVLCDKKKKKKAAKMLVVFLLDTSASMNQRCANGLSLLDCAKSAIEHFHKVQQKLFFFALAFIPDLLQGEEEE